MPEQGTAQPAQPPATRPPSSLAITSPSLFSPGLFTGQAQPDALKEHPDVPPYILNFSVDPASNNVGHISTRVVRDALSIAPGIREVLADRGITQLREAFVRAVHQLGLDITMDLKKDEIRTTMIAVGTGKHKQHLYTAEGAFYPLWLPNYFKEVPEGLTTKELRTWYAKRARYRWSAGQRVDGGIQFQCPQCAGRVVTNLKTHRKNVRPNKSAPSVEVTHNADSCCKGLATIPFDMLDRWQQIPWENPSLEEGLQPEAPGRERQRHGQGQRRTRP